MGITELFFGDDSSVEEAFQLNLENIAAGVAALNNAGITAIPMLEKMNLLIRNRFNSMDKTLRRDYAQAKQEMMMGLPAIDYQMQQAMSDAMAQSAAANIHSGSYGSTIAGQQRAQIAAQASGQAAMSRQQIASQVSGLTAQQAQLSAGFGQAEMGMRSGVVGQQASIIAGLAQAEAQMRGGITYQGQRTPGLFETVGPIIAAMAMGGTGLFAAGGAAGAGAAGAGAGAATGGGFSWLCWVAREVYGESNPKWLMFREWLLTKAPRWFRNLYIKYGERFARFISDKPQTKKAIRRWMDTKVDPA